MIKTVVADACGWFCRCMVIEGLMCEDGEADASNVIQMHDYSGADVRGW